MARRLVEKVSRLATSEEKNLLVLSEELRGAAIWSWEVAAGIAGFAPWRTASAAEPAEPRAGPSRRLALVSW